MWIVLCDKLDESAIWAFQGLRSCGLLPTELVTLEDLEDEVTWDHRVGSEGASVEFKLKDNRVISSKQLQGVLNRLQWIPQINLQKAKEKDKEYATQELYAFFISWLRALPQPILNRPSIQGFSGRYCHISEWLWLAQKAELPIQPYNISARNLNPETLFTPRLETGDKQVNTIIMVAGKATNPSAPPEIIRGCEKLVALAKTELLGAEFIETEISPWTFVGATPFPDLRLGGEAFLDALTQLFTQGRRTTG